MIGFSNVKPVPLSKGVLRVQGRAMYDGSRGYPVEVAARALVRRRPSPWISAPPVLIERGYARGQPLLFDLRFAGDAAAPEGLTTDEIELTLARPGQPPLHRARVDYVRQWSRDFAQLRALDLDRLAYSADPLSAEALGSAYDGDERGAWLAVRTGGGGRALLVVQPGPELTVLRWVYFPPPGSRATPRRGENVVVPPGGRLDVASGRVVDEEAGADLVWEPGDSRARPLNGAGLAAWRSSLLVPVAATRVFARGAPLVGTKRDWDELRDLFDNCNEVEYRRDWCVDNIWGAAGLQLRIVLRRDIRVEANWAAQLPVQGLRDFAREHNVERMLNVYFFPRVEGARAWGAADKNPGSPRQDGGLWVGDRCGGEDRDCWLRDVITIAHETGHFFNLVHLCDDFGPARPCEAGDAQYLMYGRGTQPESRLLTDEEVRTARERAWAYRP